MINSKTSVEEFISKDWEEFDVQVTVHRDKLTLYVHRKFTLTLNHPSLQNKTTDVVIQQHSRKLLMMDILMSETCWAHKKWNKITSDINLVFHSSTSYRFADSSQAVSKPVWHTPLLWVQWKTPDDGQRKCQKHVEFYSKNKFEKFVHLVNFIIRRRKQYITFDRIATTLLSLLLLQTDIDIFVNCNWIDTRWQ